MTPTACVLQTGLKAGQALKAVSDPAAPGNLWQVENRSSLRHVLDQFRMVQSGNVSLEFWPEGQAPKGERLGRDQGELVVLSGGTKPASCSIAGVARRWPVRTAWDATSACSTGPRRRIPRGTALRDHGELTVLSGRITTAAMLYHGGQQALSCGDSLGRRLAKAGNLRPASAQSA